jgi:hypothetical protein
MCTLSFYEPDDSKQLTNIATSWMPLVKFSFVPVTTGGAGFRYIAFAQFSSKDIEEVLEKHMNVIQVERKKHPDKYPKKFLEDHDLLSPLPTLTRDYCSLNFYETDDPRQLANLAMKWMPLLKVSFVPVLPSTMTIESWREVTGKK